MSLKDNEKEFSYWYLSASILFWILTIGWMLVIFFFSAENSVDSSHRSMKILNYINDLQIFPVITESIVRKGAHICEYAILTLLSFFAIRSTNLISVQTSYAHSPVKIIKSDNEMYIVISLWISAFYAAIDEYHQLFVSGRNGSIYDFLIDMAGSVIVLVIIRIVFSINLRRHSATELRYD